MSLEALTVATSVLSKVDQRSMHRFQQLASTGSVTYSHRCMDSWLKDEVHQVVRAKRLRAVEALRTAFPLPVYKLPK